MGKKKYEIAGELYELGLSKWQIAAELYKPRSKEEHSLAALKVNALINYYYKVKRDKLYDDDSYKNVNDDKEVFFDDTGGVRNTEQWKPYFSHPNKKEKKYLPLDEQIRYDLEEVLYYFHDELFKDYNESLKNVTWGMVRYANNLLYKVYGARTGKSPRQANYPKLLAYVYVVYFVALHQHYPHLLRRVKELIYERLKRESDRHTKANINKYNKYLREYLERAGEYIVKLHAIN